MVNPLHGAGTTLRSGDTLIAIGTGAQLEYLDRLLAGELRTTPDAPKRSE